MGKTKANWTSKATARLEKGVASNARALVQNLYKNILAGQLRFPKQRGFFSRIAEKVGKTRAQCKAQFARLEPQLYTEVLGVPPEDFALFASIRRRKERTRKKICRRPNKIDTDCTRKQPANASAQDALASGPDPCPEQIAPGGALGCREERDVHERTRCKIMTLFLQGKLELDFQSKGELAGKRNQKPKRT